jgi:hypothetical protein
MTLLATCPECGLRAELTVFIDAGESSQALAKALALPAPLAGQIVRYLRLFAPPKKALAQRKAARLLNELSEAIASGEVRRKGQSWAAPLGVWEAALETVLAQPPERLPLDGHGYLLAVVATQAAKSAGAGERRQEDQARTRPTTGSRQAVDLALNELINERRTLQFLERANPGVHADAIARLDAAIAAHRAAHSPNRPGGTLSHGQ